MLLETRGKDILAILWQKKKKAILLPTVICKLEIIFNQLGDIAKTFPDSVGSATYLLLASCSKMQTGVP